jgi:uncharacterized repeat protein (TIGR02543 family)
MPANDVTYYPYATLNSYTITFNPNGGSGSNQTITKTYGSTIASTEVTSPTKATTTQYTYAFSGWYTASSGGTKVTFPVTITGDVTYYAQYSSTERSYSWTFDRNGGSGSNQVITKTYSSTIASSEVTSPSKAATNEYTYTFNGWYDAATGGVKYSFPIAVEVGGTMYAQYTQNTRYYT